MKLFTIIAAAIVACSPLAAWAADTQVGSGEVHGYKLVWQDLFDAADSAAKLVGTGATSPNEIRKALGLPPIAESWADGYQMTKNNEVAGGGETNGND